MALCLPLNQLHTNRLHEAGISTRAKVTTHTFQVAIVNIMPQAEEYEFLLLNRLGATRHTIEPLFFRVRNHPYRSTDHEHLNRYYNFTDQIVSHKPVAVILTGAPVEQMPANQITYYQEIQNLLTACIQHQIPLLGICWGGIAVAAFLGIGSQVLRDKISGVFKSNNVAPNHALMKGIKPTFHCPQSRFASLIENDVANQTNHGVIVPLATLSEKGTFIIQSTDGLLTAHLGHPEYLPERLLFEYHRDIATDPNLTIEGFDPANPVDKWSPSSKRFFNNWLNNIPYKNKNRRKTFSFETSAPA